MPKRRQTDTRLPNKRPNTLSFWDADAVDEDSIVYSDHTYDLVQVFDRMIDYEKIYSVDKLYPKKKKESFLDYDIHQHVRDARRAHEEYVMADPNEKIEMVRKIEDTLLEGFTPAEHKPNPYGEYPTLKFTSKVYIPLMCALTEEGYNAFKFYAYLKMIDMDGYMEYRKRSCRIESDGRLNQSNEFTYIVPLPDNKDEPNRSQLRLRIVFGEGYYGSGSYVFSYYLEKFKHGIKWIRIVNKDWDLTRFASNACRELTRDILYYDIERFRALARGDKVLNRPMWMWDFCLCKGDDRYFDPKYAAMAFQRWKKTKKFMLEGDE